MASLFISYSRKDIDAARKLTEALKAQDLDFWIDWEGIPPIIPVVARDGRSVPPILNMGGQHPASREDSKN